MKNYCNPPFVKSWLHICNPPEFCRVWRAWVRGGGGWVVRDFFFSRPFLHVGNLFLLIAKKIMEAFFGLPSLPLQKNICMFHMYGCNHINKYDIKCKKNNMFRCELYFINYNYKTYSDIGAPLST